MGQRILVLGISGMLGHKLFQVLGERHEDTWGTLRPAREAWFLRDSPLFASPRVLYGLDATEQEGLDEILRDLKPTVIVNAVGAIKQRPEAGDAETAIAVNALLPHKLVRAATTWGGRVVHFSTDCVFSGARGRYREDDAPDASDLYGRTKLLGEVAARNAITLRTSFIGRELHQGRSLLEWFLSQNHGAVRGYTRVFWSGVTSNHLADVVADVIDHHPDLSGLYHLAAARLSKYELLLALREAYGLDVAITPDDAEVCDRSLDGSRFAEATGYRPPPWTALIRQMQLDPTPYERWATSREDSR